MKDEWKHSLRKFGMLYLFVFFSRPMDLSTIKKNIESGAIRSTVEFQRDISLMFFNSIIYNPNYHEINRLAREMYAESTTVIQVIFIFCEF